MKNQLVCCLSLFSTLLLSVEARSQYYYKDIVSHQQHQEKFARMKKARLSTVSVQSFEASGAASDGFHLTQVINNSFTQVRTRMETAFSGRMAIINYYQPSGLLYKTIDSGFQTVTVYQYAYDSLNRVIAIEQQAQATGDKQKSIELHRWTYGPGGAPLRMTKLRDGGDSTIVELMADSLGRVMEEYVLVDGKPGEKTYYYYDASGRLSDIVRYNARAGKLVADYMFDYEDNGLIRQMVTLEQGTGTSTTWIYLYNEQQLVAEEKCYNAQKKLAGRMAYQYVLRK